MKEQDRNLVNFQADRVLDEHLEDIFIRHRNCGCAQCIKVSENMADYYFYGVDADWLDNLIRDRE